jgi:hypothetical protein
MSGRSSNHAPLGVDASHNTASDAVPTGFIHRCNEPLRHSITHSVIKMTSGSHNGSTKLRSTKTSVGTQAVA